MRRALLLPAAALLAATIAADAGAATRRAPCAEGAKQPRCVFTDGQHVRAAPGVALQTGVVRRRAARVDAQRLARLEHRAGKGVVSLRTTDDLVTACEAWGAASCR